MVAREGEGSKVEFRVWFARSTYTSGFPLNGLVNGLLLATRIP